MKKTREQIQRLRKETRDLRNSLHQCMIGDEEVLDKAFDGHQVERAAFRFVSQIVTTTKTAPKFM